MIDPAQPPSPTDLPLKGIQNILQQSEELDLASTRRNLRVRNEIFVPLVYHKNKFLHWQRCYDVFLEAFKPGVSLKTAAEAAGITPERAMRFLRRKELRLYFHDLSKQIAIRRSWPERWWNEVGEIYDGKKVVSPLQLEVLEWVGDRVAPKPSRLSTGTSETKIEIHIDPAAVQEAFRRQSAIEGELIEESA